MSDKDVKKLPHYTQFKLEPLDFIRANKGILDFMQANVIKYVCRYKLKNGKEDLLKARNYLDILIEEWDKEHAPEQPANYTIIEVTGKTMPMVGCGCWPCVNGKPCCNKR